jgi:hypothetical protein
MEWLPTKVEWTWHFGFAGAVYGGFAHHEHTHPLQIDLDQVMRVAIDKAQDYRSLDPNEASTLLSELEGAGALQKNWTATRAFVRYVQYVRPLGILGAVKNQMVCNWIWTPRKPALKN